MQNNKEDNALLRVKNLSIHSNQGSQNRQILDDISFEILPGTTLALVGESGSGKTVTAMALLGLLPDNLIQTSGEVFFEGQSISASGKHSFSRLRGKHISMVFQEPVSSLNPVFEIGNQLATVIRTHSEFTRKEAIQKALTCLNDVGLPNPEQVYHSYPHQLSGGMAQRVMIAMALSCKPQLVIADEPTTALDVTTQLNILKLINYLQKTYNFSLLLISHDMHIVSSLAEEIVMLQNGQVVYQGSTTKLFHSDQNNYVRSFFEMMLPPATP